MPEGLKQLSVWIDPDIHNALPTDRSGPTRREIIEALLRYWLTLSDAERAALLEARDER